MNAITIVAFIAVLGAASATNLLRAGPPVKHNEQTKHDHIEAEVRPASHNHIELEIMHEKPHSENVQIEIVGDHSNKEESKPHHFEVEIVGDNNKREQSKPHVEVELVQAKPEHSIELAIIKDKEQPAKEHEIIDVELVKKPMPSKPIEVEIVNSEPEKPHKLELEIEVERQ